MHTLHFAFDLWLKIKWWYTCGNDYSSLGILQVSCSTSFWWFVDVYSFNFCFPRFVKSHFSWNVVECWILDTCDSVTVHAYNSRCQHYSVLSACYHSLSSFYFVVDVAMALCTDENVNIMFTVSATDRAVECACLSIHYYSLYILNKTLNVMFFCCAKGVQYSRSTPLHIWVLTIGQLCCMHGCWLAV